MMEADKLREALGHFNNGSEQFYRHALMRRMLMTQGVMFLAENAGAHWLADIVASWQIKPKVRREEFQVWQLLVREGESPLSYEIDGGKRRYVPREYKAIVTMTDGNSKTPIVTQTIPYTDFPLPEGIKLWLEKGGEHWTLMLPSER